MKLKNTFVTQEMDGEQVMVEADGGFAGMVRSNATAAFIIDQLKTETTKEAIRTLADIYIMNQKLGGTLNWEYVDSELRT